MRKTTFVPQHHSIGPRRINSSVTNKKSLVDDEVESYDDSIMIDKISDKVIDVIIKHHEKMISENNKIIDLKLASIKNDILSSPAKIDVDLSGFDRKLSKMSDDIKDAIIARNKEYEKQYEVLQGKYDKLKNTQESQFFRFSSLISSYQHLIYKMQTTLTNPELMDEYKKLDEVVKTINKQPIPLKSKIIASQTGDANY